MPGSEFAGRVAIVTGAGGGLGLAHAESLARRGARLVVNDLGGGTLGLPEQGRDEDMAERAAARLRASGAEAIAHPGSVADPGTAKALVALALERWGRVDVLINNAGIASAAFFPDVDDAELQRHVDVSLAGCLRTMRAVWPHMVERGYGRILNTGSAACFGNPIASYASTKAGLWGLTKTVALFAAAHDIRVNLLLPASWSRLTAQLPASEFRDRLERDFTPEKVSPLAALLVDERCPVNGEVFSAGGGRVARAVYAVTEAVPLGGELEDAARAVERVMSDDAFRALSSTHDDMVNLGFPPE